MTLFCAAMCLPVHWALCTHVDGHFVFLDFGMAFPFSMCFETILILRSLNGPKLGPGRFLAMFWENASPKHNK